MSNSNFESLMKQAFAASAAQDIEMTLHLYRDAAKINPSSAIPHLLMGAELAQCGRIEEAEVAYSNAILLAPDLSIARYQLGLLQFTSGHPALALVTWQPLLTCERDGPLASFVRGFSALAGDQFDEALSEFRIGLQKNTSNIALNSDIQKVISRIDDLISKRISSIVESNDNATTESDESSDKNVHVLLSNYQRQGSLH